MSRSFQPSGEGLSLAVNAAELKPESSLQHRGRERKPSCSMATRRRRCPVFQLDCTNIKTTDPIDPDEARARRTSAYVRQWRSLSKGRLSDRLRAQAGYAYLDAAVLPVELGHERRPHRGQSSWPGADATAQTSGPHYVATAKLSVGGGLTSDTAIATRRTTTSSQLPGYARADAAVDYRTRTCRTCGQRAATCSGRATTKQRRRTSRFSGTPRDVVSTCACRADYPRGNP